MAGTNLYAVQAALLTLLQGEQGSGEGLENVNVDWSYVGKHDITEYVFFGDEVGGPMNLAAMKGGSAARIRREENLTGSLHIRVRRKGQQTTQTAVQRACELGAVVEGLIALDPSLGGVTGLLKATVDNVACQSDVDDDGATAILTYTIAYHSTMT